jgi:hypothetical protein
VQITDYLVAFTDQYLRVGMEALAADRQKKKKRYQLLQAVEQSMAVAADDADNFRYLCFPRSVGS